MLKSADILLPVVLVLSWSGVVDGGSFLQGDLDESCRVDFADVRYLAQRWLDTSCMAPDCRADIDGRGGVDFFDFAGLARNWREGCPGVTLLINEFMASNNSGSGIRDEHGDYDDWIEIHNYGDDAVNIAGIYLIDDANESVRWRAPADNPTATIIPAGGFLTIWADSETREGTLHASFKLSADSGTEDICLFDADGAPIDSILDFPVQQPNKSYGRYPDGGALWRVFDGPTPGKTNGVAPPAVVISEIMYHPFHVTSGSIEPENRLAEYIELLNTGDDAVDLSGWRFSNGVDFAFGDISLGSGEYLVVAADVDTFRATYPGVNNVIGGWTGRLSNQSETIELVDGAGIRIDRIAYADEGEWAVRRLGPLDYYHRGWEWSDEHDGGGGSLELINPALPNEHGQNWAASQVNGGTPGAANSIADNDIAPLILDARHYPVIPGPDNQVTVTARIVDELGAGVSVTLYYGRDVSIYEDATVYPHYDANNFGDTAMLDDGAHGDGPAGDGVFGAQLPAYPHGAIVEFYVKAVDAAANVRTWPAPCFVDGVPEQVANALYQVDGTFDPDARWKPGSQPIYYLITTNGEAEELADIADTDYGGNLFASEAMSNAQANATFISVDGVDTQIRYCVGIRNRGHGSRADPPMNYRINFRHDQPWKDVTALNIDSKYTHLQFMGGALFQLAGLAAMDTTIVQVRLNGVNLALDDYRRMYGSYVAIEAYDRDWPENNFPDDAAGNIYQCSFFYDGFNPWTFADLDYKEDEGETPDPDDYRNNYRKQTNGAEDDWSDLFTLIDTLNNPAIPDADFIEEVSRVINLDKWMRYLAADVLVGNREGGLGTGRGDDYALYRGVEDPRFWLLPHDLDAVLGQGLPGYQPANGIFGYARIPGLNRLLNHPDSVKLYYEHCRDLAETLFQPDNIFPFVERMLGGWVARSEIEGPQGIKEFVPDRLNNVLYGGQTYPPQIPQTFAIHCPLPVVDGFYRTDIGIVGLEGTANAIETRSVRVGDISPADCNWLQRDGTWSVEAVALNPGINRIPVWTYGGADGTGTELRREHIDIWCDTNDLTAISGPLAFDVTLDAGSGPYYVAGELTVPAGTTLTVEPGATIYFAQGAILTVRGRLLAEGTPHRRIRLTRRPGSFDTWQGLAFDGATDNRLTYADMEYSSSGGESISLSSSTILIGNVAWSGTNETILSIFGSSVVVRNCVFPGARSSAVSGRYLLASDPYMLFENNVFGVCSGLKQNVLNFSTSGSATVPRFASNTFLGGGDDGLSLGGTNAYVEGNVFMNFHRSFSPEEGESYAITAGSDAGHSSNHVIVRNLFVNCDNAVLVKDRSWATLANNTIVNCAEAGVNFDEPLNARVNPGLGGHLEGNIFWNTPVPLAQFYIDDPVWGTTDITVDYSILPPAWHYLGRGNLDEDPQFEDPNGDFHISPMSPARGALPCGRDIGAYGAAGACIWGEPDEITYQTTAVLSVGGPGITHYRYSVNDTDSWSDVLPVDAPIELTGLAESQSYTVYVKGRDYAGTWQSDPCYVPSRTWTVDTSHSRLVINEILAHTHGADPDIIELYYDGPGSIDLTGMSLTDDPIEPNKFVISGANVSKTTLDPGDYLTLYGDLNAHLKDHLGFALSAEGESLYLYAAPADGGALVDWVTFGPQINDYSIGRIGYGGVWKLTRPTFGLPNAAQPTGDPHKLKINEWLANGDVLFDEDFIELYNPGSLPVDLSELYLTDNPVTQPAKQKLGPLTFAPPGGFAVFAADDANAPGHLSFRLSADGEILALLDAELSAIDTVFYGPQTTDVAEGCIPDGQKTIDFQTLPTPGAPNPVPATASTLLVPENADKRVLVPIYDIGAAWRTLDFNDAGWTLCTGGPGGVGYEIGPGDPINYVDLITLDVQPQMRHRNPTCYIRVPFTLSVDPSPFNGLLLRMRYDDGFVAYLNGAEVARDNFDGDPNWRSNTVREHADENAVFLEDFDISAHVGALRQGLNVLAIHGMNIHRSSFDFLISAGMTAAVTTWDSSVVEARALLDGLRVTELMYHDSRSGELEFVELKNIADAPLNLEGVRFSEGVEFVFPAMMLDPGQYVIVVDNLSAFAEEYGQKNVAGAYANNLSNGGEDIVLQLPWPYEAAIMRFEYDDTWRPSTDGQGDSLVIVDPCAHPAAWNHPENWRADSPTPGGE